MAYVMSNVASGTVNNVDATEALAMDGVRGYIDWQDVPGSLVSYSCLKFEIKY